MSLTLYSNNIFKIEEDPGEAKKAGWVDFKHVVWHSSFYEVLGTIHILSKIGFHIKCADNVVHHVFPVILILSADYEEQYVLLYTL